MIAIAYYLLKVMICSGILYGYYHLALKDKVFHQWNRFYLLGSVLISMLLPLVQVELNTPVQPESKVITVLQMVSGADEYVREVNAKSISFLNGEFLSMAAYGLVSLITLVLFLLALHRIRQMIRRHEAIAIDDFYFLNTAEPGTPFSFFRFLLWNREIPLDTENGQRILEHELVHIREKHSWDKLFMQLTLVIFWINPFFWLIRKELSLVHEFIADRKTVGSGDAQAFARLLLETSFPGYAPMMTNSFFTSSIKRRLAMMTKQQHPGLNYFSRLMMIPVLFVLLFVFSVKAKNMLTPESNTYRLDKPVTVVIDAGHGGTDAGAMAGSITEKNLNLAIAQEIKRLNTNPNLKLVFTRETDVFHNVKEKTAFSQKSKAELFVSIHINAAPTEDRSGIEAVVSGNVDNPFAQQNARIASILLKNISSVYKTDMTIKKRERTVYVLDKNICPSVIVEMGYLTNNNDLQFISNATNQEKLARQVLKSIEEYFNPSVLVLSATDNTQAKDTLPDNQPISINVAGNGERKITFIHQDGRVEVKTNNQYRKETGKDIMFTSDTIYLNKISTVAQSKQMMENFDYKVDGKPSYYSALERIKPEEIFSIEVQHPKAKGQRGYIHVVTKAGLANDSSLLKRIPEAQTTPPAIDFKAQSKTFTGTGSIFKAQSETFTSTGSIFKAQSETFTGTGSTGKASSTIILR